MHISHFKNHVFGVYVIGNAQKLELTNILASTRSILNEWTIQQFVLFLLQWN
jgi:hypothetical protein